MCAQKLNDTDIMSILIETALKNGATAADCVLSRSRGVSLTRRLGKDENIERYEDFDTGLRVFVGNKIASVSTNESSENSIKEVANRAVEMAKIAPKDEFSLIADKETLFTNPRHPYTRMLFNAIPDINMSGKERIPVSGEVPNPIEPPSGCTFHPRCPIANERCKRERPELQIVDSHSQVACHAIEEKRNMEVHFI